MNQEPQICRYGRGKALDNLVVSRVTTALRRDKGRADLAEVPIVSEGARSTFAANGQRFE
jgi:hypothetical protein